MKIAKYIFLILIVLLTSGIASMIFYDAAIRVQDKKILIINFKNDTEVVIGNDTSTLKIFDLKEFKHNSLDDLSIKINGNDKFFKDFDLKHEKIMVTVSDLEFCYVQSELLKSGKFETIKELTSENNTVRIDDKDYHVKTLVDLSQGRNFNYQYILPVECALTPEQKLEQINQYVNYNPEEQRLLLETELKEIQESTNLEELRNLIK